MSSPRLHPNPVRPAAVAGTWYPSDPRELVAQIESMLRTATPSTHGGRLRALVVPHAGLRYSGPTAACAYTALAAGDHRRVVVLAPNHRVALMGAAVDPSSAYETPLGRMAVDEEAVERLAGQPHFACSARPFAAEHAIEMQLPYLQHFLPQALLVPVLVGELRGGREVDDLAQSLGMLVDSETLFVVSSDFMHYGHAFGYVPFTEHVAEKIQQYDAQAIATLMRASLTDFTAVLERTGNTICGRRPLEVFLKLVPRHWECELRDYTTSGAITGDWSHSVSYAALAFHDAAVGADAAVTARADAASPGMATAECADTTRPGTATSQGVATRPGTAAQPPPSNPEPGFGPASLSLDDQRCLLRLARRSIEHAAGARGAIDTEKASWSAALHTSLAAFVSLHRRADGVLRGCIGWLEPHAALAEAVIDNAASAARRDPRFPPVEAGEVDGLEIEISVLGPLQDVDDVADIEVGRDGLVLVHEGARGVLLPQVAVHMGWDRSQFLAAVCRKAGLHADAWRRGAWIRRFEALVFSEGEMRQAAHSRPDGGLG